ncbi:MAG: DUF4365 domain-containing protein [Pseudomonadota bacterium]
MITRKKRTREHIIADISVNYVEHFIVTKGFSVERVQGDYGYDLVMFTYDTDGEIENGQVYLQLKATDHINKIDNSKVAFSVSTKDLNLWLEEPMPVILILYDAIQKEAYWLYVQAYFEKHKINLNQKYITVYFDMKNALNEETINQFREYKINVLKQVKNMEIQHDI